MLVFKTKPFARFARRAGISDRTLMQVAKLVNDGKADADLGGGVFKQRIARSGEGKSGGIRSILLLRKDDRAVFVFGFEKKDLADLKSSELDAFRKYGKAFFGYSTEELWNLVKREALIQTEVENAQYEN